MSSVPWYCLFMKYTKERLTEAVKVAVSFCDVLRFFNTPFSGGAHAHVRRSLAKFGIDTSHFTGAKTIRLGIGKYHFKDVLVKDRQGIKKKEKIAILRRAFLESGIEEKCLECGLPALWNNKPIRLQIDHRDGDWSNNEPANLRFLCPNCHSQTENFGSKNIKEPTHPNPEGMKPPFRRLTRYDHDLKKVVSIWAPFRVGSPEDKYDQKRRAYERRAKNRKS